MLVSIGQLLTNAFYYRCLYKNDKTLVENIENIAYFHLKIN
jgi:hypothetical protein